MMGKTKLYPKFKYKDGFSVMDRIESVEHPFLQEIINMKGGLFLLEVSLLYMPVIWLGFYYTFMKTQLKSNA